MTFFFWLSDRLNRQHLLHDGHHRRALPDRLPPVLQTFPRVAGQSLHHPHLPLLLPLQHSKVLRAQDSLSGHGDQRHQPDLLRTWTCQRRSSLQRDGRVVRVRNLTHRTEDEPDVLSGLNLTHFWRSSSPDFPKYIFELKLLMFRKRQVTNYFFQVPVRLL